MSDTPMDRLYRDIQEANRARGERLDWVARMMPEECALALDRFVRVNPTWRGANWEDVLDVLLDTDSHIEVTDYIYEALDGADKCSEVAVTLLYAYGGAPTPDEVRAVLDRT